MLPAEHITNDTRILFKREKERIIFEFSQKSAGCVSILHRDLLLASIYNVKCATSCWKSIINRRRIYSRVVDRVEHGRINQAKRGTFYVAIAAGRKITAYTHRLQQYGRNYERKKIIYDSQQRLLVQQLFVLFIKKDISFFNKKFIQIARILINEEN